MKSPDSTSNPTTPPARSEAPGHTHQADATAFAAGFQKPITITKRTPPAESRAGDYLSK
jgi:hypothetical protein